MHISKLVLFCTLFKQSLSVDIGVLEIANQADTKLEPAAVRAESAP